VTNNTRRPPTMAAFFDSLQARDSFVLD